MPNNTKTIQITIHPYSFGDPECAIQEWFEDYDPECLRSLDRVEIISEEFEKYKALVVENTDKSFTLEQVSDSLERAGTVAWVTEEVGTLQECVDFVKNCPGTGNPCRIRKADKDWMISRGGELRIVPNTSSSPDEYWVEVNGDVGSERWAELHSGTYQECYTKMLMEVTSGGGDARYRIRPAEGYSITYEHVQNGTIVANVTITDN